MIIITKEQVKNLSPYISNLSQLINQGNLVEVLSAIDDAAFEWGADEEGDMTSLGNMIQGIKLEVMMQNSDNEKKGGKFSFLRRK